MLVLSPLWSTPLLPALWLTPGLARRNQMTFCLESWIKVKGTDGSQKPFLCLVFDVLSAG